MLNFFLKIAKAVDFTEPTGGIVKCGPGHPYPPNTYDASGNLLAGDIPCGKDQFFALVGTIQQYAIVISMLAVTAAVAYAGVMYVISGGEAEKISKAKGAIKSAVIGFVVVTIGYIVINSVLMIFGCSQWNVFNVNPTCEGI